MQAEEERLVVGKRVDLTMDKLKLVAMALLPYHYR